MEHTLEARHCAKQTRYIGNRALRWNIASSDCEMLGAMLPAGFRKILSRHENYSKVSETRDDRRSKGIEKDIKNMNEDPKHIQTKTHTLLQSQHIRYGETAETCLAYIRLFEVLPPPIDVALKHVLRCTFSLSLYIYMYICMYVFMYVCMLYIYTYIYF